MLPRNLGLGAALLVLLSCARANEPALASERINELPTFVVEEKFLAEPREYWRYAAVPGFEILASTSDRNTRHFLREFLKYRVVLGAIFPEVSQIQDEAPTTLILCGRGRAFGRFLRKNSNGHGDFTRSIYGADRERTVIVLDMIAGEITSNEDMRLVDDPYDAINREYFRFILRKLLGPAVQPWLEAGLVRLVGATEFTDRVITFGRLGSHGEKVGSFHSFFAGGTSFAPPVMRFNAEPPRGAFPNSPLPLLSGGGHLRNAWTVQSTQGHVLLPMGELFSPPSDMDPVDRLTWEMQCYAFVHMCILGEGGKLQKGLLEFTQRALNEPVDEALFKECFGRSYRAMGIQLRSYVEFTAFTVPRLSLKKGETFGEPADVVLREASDAEIGRLKGDALRLTGIAEAARISLIAPYIRGERDPELLAALGLAELAVGESARARRFLEKAHAGKTTRALALVELARLRLAEACTAPAASGGRLGNGQLASVLTPLFESLDHKPGLADTYTLIAEAWRQAATKPSAAQLQVLDYGVTRFPRDVPMVLAATEAYASHGFADKTALLARFGEKIASDPVSKTRFAELRRAFPGTAVPAQP